MTRRMLDSSVWANENFASLPPMARLLLIGVINLADDQGRMKAHPVYLRSQIFPYDDVDAESMTTWLTTLAAHETVALYEVDGKQYLQLLNWWKYQTPSFAAPSQYPRIAGWQDRIRYTGKGRNIYTCNWISSTGELLKDSCDMDGNPLVGPYAVPPGQPYGQPGEPLNENKDKDKDKGEIARDVPPTAPPTKPESPPLPEHYAAFAEQANGNAQHYQPRVKVVADAYTEQARKLGIEPRSFSARISALASCVGKRSYIDAADEDLGTLNALKAGVITLHKLGYCTEADYRQLCESFAAANEWMDTPVPTLRQLTDHAGKVKDGVTTKPRTKIPKANSSGYFDFPTMAAARAAAATNGDIRNRVTVKGTKVSI